VASRLILDVAEEQMKGLQGSPSDLNETMAFWCLIGLVEIGDTGKVEEFLQKYKPTDLRLLFGISLACYFVTNLRMSSQSEKETAKRISTRLAKKTRHLNLQLLDEFKSMLLEERDGEIKALPHTPPKELTDECEGDEVPE
jgi:hypothetical protein